MGLGDGRWPCHIVFPKYKKIIYSGLGNGQWPVPHFCHLKTGTFGKSAHLQVNKKWHFKRPNLRTDSKNLAKHPTKC